MKFVKYLLILLITLTLLGAASLFGLYKYVEKTLPDVSTLRDIKLQVPMQIYSADNQLIAQFGEKRRIPLTLEQVPPMMINAIIATEDSRFYQHHGVDPIGIARAVIVATISGHASQGASTITQQLAKNIFLTPERALMRKIKEVFLAIKMEQMFSKEEILELYLNKIYFGYRSYGIGAAAKIYFDKEVSQLTLSEMATLAGLPKAPSTLNPLHSLPRATARRNVVLERMLDEGYINEKLYSKAKNSQIIAGYHIPEMGFSAPYLTEMVRQEMVKRYGEEEAYTRGYKVYTTVTKKAQQAAEIAVKENVFNYDMRHGYRGPLQILWRQEQAAWSTQKIVEKLEETPSYAELTPAVIFSVNAEKARIILKGGDLATLDLDSVRWARRYKTDSLQGNTPKSVDQVLNVGEMIWTKKEGDKWMLSQLPQVNSALVSLDPRDGAITALVGGFDFTLSKFNRATQAIRQIGSNIKPFLYAAAMDKGLTLASILNDLPISRWDAGSGADWTPKNYPAKYAGPIRLRRGLGQSKNVVMVRAMRAMGIDYASDYLKRFGFPEKNMAHGESLALGAASFTPLQLARGYAVLANGGYLVNPYFITHIEDNAGKVIYHANPLQACPDCNIPVIYPAVERADMLLDDHVEESVTTTQTNIDVDNLMAQADTQTLDEMNPSPIAIGTHVWAPHVIDSPLTFLMRSALKSNVLGEAEWQGTAWRAKSLKRNDVGGKTGTTNDSKDAWFSGFGGNAVATVWVGFDDHRRTLGRSASSPVYSPQVAGDDGGAKTAQPAWNMFMAGALQGEPDIPAIPPAGIVSVRIDKATGKLSKSDKGSRDEFFLKGTEPTEYAVEDSGMTLFDGDDALNENGESEELF